MYNAKGAKTSRPSPEVEKKKRIKTIANRKANKR